MRRERDRSVLALLSALLGIAVLAYSLGGAWYTYDSSSGRRTPTGGLHDPNDTRTVAHHVGYGPFLVEGDVPPTDPGTARTTTTAMGWLTWAALGLLVLAAFGDVPGLARIMPRRLGLLMTFLALAATGAAAALAWYVLPGTLSGYGVTDTFTSVKQEDGYIRTTLTLAWVAAAAAAAPIVATFAFKFQSGSADPGLVADIAAARKEGA